MAAVRRSGLGARHTLIERADYLALPELLAAGTCIDLAYIDGSHVFDHVLLDFWYLDRMAPPGGLIAFNDCGWPAVHKAIRFMRTHRRYTEVDVGLGTAYRGRTWPRRFRRWLSGAPEADYYRNTNDRYFEKREHWEPRWDFFADF